MAVLPTMLSDRKNDTKRKAVVIICKPVKRILGSSMQRSLSNKLKLRILKDTELKRYPVDSEALVPEKKQLGQAGIELEISSYKVQDDYYSFDSVDSRFLGHGYAYFSDVKISGGEVS